MLDNSLPKQKKILVVFYLITGCYTLSASIIWGVNTLFLLDSGLDILGVFIANGVFTAGMAIFEIPTGVLADTMGRRTSFLLSVIMLTIGTIGYVWVGQFMAGSLVMFCVMSVVLAIGFTFYSGAVEAWLVDALHSVDFQGSLDEVFARGSMVFGAAMLVGTISGGLIGSIDLAWPYIFRICLLVLVFAIAAYYMHDLGFERRSISLRQYPSEMAAIARDSVSFGWQQPGVRYLILAGSVQAVFMAWGYHAWQPYFLGLLGQDIVWVAGLIAAMISLAGMLGNSLIPRLRKYNLKRSTLMIVASIISAGAVIGVGFANTFWVAVGLYLLVMVAFGLINPVKQAFIHTIIPSDKRATVISFDSLVASTGSFIGQGGLGYLAHSTNLANGYIIGGLTSLLAIPLLRNLAGISHPADRSLHTSALDDKKWPPASS